MQAKKKYKTVRLDIDVDLHRLIIDHTKLAKMSIKSFLRHAIELALMPTTSHSIVLLRAGKKAEEYNWSPTTGSKMTSGFKKAIKRKKKK